AVDKAPVEREDVLYLHLQLRGFVDPDLRLVGELVQALEASNALPFGDRTQHKWISLFPPAVGDHEADLISDDQNMWSRIIDKFIALETQFKQDVFWRVRSLSEEKDG